MRWWESSWDYNPELYDRVSVISDRTVLELLFLSLLDFLDFSLICWCPSIWLLIWASYSITLFNELSPAQHMLVNCTNFVPICVIDLTLSLPIFLFINKTETQDPIIVCLDLSLQVLLGLVAIPRGVFLICWFSLSALFTEVGIIFR